MSKDTLELLVLANHFMNDLRVELLRTYQLKYADLQMLRRMFKINAQGLIEDKEMTHEDFHDNVDSLQIELTEVIYKGLLSAEALKQARRMLMINNDFVFDIKLRATAQLGNVIPLNTKVVRALSEQGIETVNDLLMQKREDIVKLNNFGRVSVKIVDNFLTRFNLSWGMTSAEIRKRLVG